MTSDNKLFINLSAKLDEKASTKLINQNIKELEKNINNIKIKAELDTVDLDKQIKEALKKVKEAFKDVKINVKPTSSSGKDNSNNNSSSRDNDYSTSEEFKRASEYAHDTNRTTQELTTILKEQGETLQDFTIHYDRQHQTTSAITKQYDEQGNNLRSNYALIKDIENGTYKWQETDTTYQEKKATDAKQLNELYDRQKESLASMGVDTKQIAEWEEKIAKARANGDSLSKTTIAMNSITQKTKEQYKTQVKNESLTKQLAEAEDKVRKNIENSNLSIKKRAELQEKINKLHNSDLSQEDQIKGFKALNSEINITAKNTKSLGYMFKTAFTKFNVWMVVTDLFYKSARAFKSMYATIVNLDTALTELRKVTNATDRQLASITTRAYEAASQLGRTGQEVIEASSEWARAGYTLEESFSLAKTTILFTNIADGIDSVTEASSSLISVISAFNLNDSDAMRIIDIINEVNFTSLL